MARELAQSCPTDWQRAQTPDGGITLCTPAGFHPDAGDPVAPTAQARWARGAPGNPDFAMLRVEQLDSAAVVQEWGSTTARLTPLDRAADPQRADAVASELLSADSVQVGDNLVLVETARVSGGAMGMRRQPYLRARWQTAPNSWIFVTGLATDTSVLRVLSAMVRTVRVGPGRPDRRATR